MSIRLCFVLFLAPFAFCGDEQLPAIDVNVLQNIFGNPQAFAQAIPVTDTSYDAETNLTQVVEPSLTQSSQDYDSFDWALTKRIAALSNSENFLLSPLGLKLALAVLTEAATGPTKAELASVLGNELNSTAVKRKYATMLESLHTQSSAYILNLGSKIFVGHDVHPAQKFAALAQDFYHTKLENIDFHHPKEAADKINAWVANVTAGRISALVDDEDVAGTIAMVLTTLYFKGNWTHQFPLTATKSSNFFVAGTDRINVPFMNVKNKFFYTESEMYDAKIVRLPYLGNKFSMYVVVPNSLLGLDRVMSLISVGNLRTEMGKLKEHPVQLSLPKFRCDYTTILDSILRELGIRQAFEDTASFPGIARGKGLPHLIKISKVLQRNGIEVNEVGSVAYSATEISLVNKFGGDDELFEEVTADRPFLFFIQDETTRQILFTGRVCNPAIVDGAFKKP